jgi:Domain of unknown function (DUF5134)
MASPAWLADLFASAMLLMAGYCASRLILARAQQRPAERDIDLVHVLMGLAMAGMLVPGLTLLGGRSLWDTAWWTSGWATVFGGFAVWFGWRIGRFYRAAGRLTPASAHHLPHLVMSGAMVYMLVAVSRPALAGGTGGGPADAIGMGSTAAGGIRFPLLAILLAQFMAAYVMWAADRLPALAPVRAWRASPVTLAAATPEPSPAGATGPSPARQPAGTLLAGPPPAGAQLAGLGSAGLGPAGSSPPPAQPGGRAPLSPRLAACCNIAMGVVMGYMLVIML